MYIQIDAVLMFILIGVIRICFGDKNNVCKSVEDYRSMDGNPNCWFDSIVNSSVPEIIMRSGRPLEIHKVTTSDGHILTIFRMPNNKRKNPVFLQHGLITTCANWISLGNDSLGFQLYDSGYDVWLGNYRGTQYSQEHVKYTVEDEEFWNHSLDEVSLIDIPTMLAYIAKETQGYDKIIFIGHSLGTTLGLMYTSDRPVEAAKLMKLQILTAPAYTLVNLKAIARYLLPFRDLIYNTVNQISGLTTIVSKEQTTKGILKLFCMDSPEMMQQCMTMLWMIYGPKTSIHPDKYPMYFQQHPSGTSIKLIRHCGDLPMNHFRKFDYGYAGNFRKYGSLLPPEYDIGKVRVPTIVILARNDWLTPKEDAINLYRHLPPEYRKAIFEITEENFNHIDFMFGTKAKPLYVDKVLTILDKYT